MSIFAKKIRFTVWILRGVVSRYGKLILFAFLFGLTAVVIFSKFGSVIWHDLNRENKVMGIVGTYSPTNLPISIQRIISSGLTDVSEDGMPLPALAQSWEISADGKTYIFHLKPGVTWHDGKPFSAKDINYNIKDVDFSASDASTLVVKLKELFVPLPNFLSKPLFKKGLIGVGDYKISAIRLKGDAVSYLKLSPVKENLSQIEVKFYPTESIAKTGFLLGEVNELIDVNNFTSFTEWKTVKLTENIKYDQYFGIFFNTNDSVLKDKDIRQGLSYAIDKPEKDRVTTPLSTKSWAYTNRVKQFEKDLDQAKLLLRTFTSDGKATITLSTFSQYYSLAQSIAASWKAVGVETNIKIENGIPDNYQALLVTQEIPQDPDQYTLWHSTQTQTNISSYSNPKIDKLLEDGRREMDLEKRKKIYFDFQRYLVEDTPAVFLFHPTTYKIDRV